ncbi:peptidoglycan amidohydrolase family protein [Rothia mucilaginosa]|jgi:N-acetylmuramoyl-L-alanine amidase|uniref:peptidoglycan amidohydrolase family protein n=1 Tax=Rothia mucilaginosa TaxID=43675 RepID=UPI000A8937F7|nr:peptidoglycan amidohydrolase family protein [Rothia mucilaginosa]
MAKIDQAIAWMEQRKGKVTYSMNYRTGPHSYDCSSAVYSALHEAGLLPKSTGLGSTESLFNDLEKYGWTQVRPDASGNYPARRGDVFIWGKRGQSYGAAGHTGIFYDDHDTIIHCNAGHNGISINPHDTIWSYNGGPAITIYRPPAEVNEEEVIYRATKNAMNAIFDEPFVRQGDLAKARYGNSTIGLRAVVHWFDTSMIRLETSLKELENAIRAL